jgi:MFS family permease
VLVGLVAAGYAAIGAFATTLGPGPVVIASMANLTFFWLSLAYTVAQRRPWLILLFALGGLLGYGVAEVVVDPSPGLHMQLALVAFNLLGVGYMIARALLAHRRPHTFLEPSGASTLSRRRRRFVAALGIGYGFLVLSDFIVLATVGYFDTTWNGTETYLVLKLVAIIPLLVSLGVMEVLEQRLGETIRRQEERLPSSDPRFTTAIRRAFLVSVAAFSSLHVLLGLGTATLLLPGMPLRAWVSESALTADITVPGLLATLGIVFALGGMFCATLLSTMGEDEISLKWLVVGLALSLVVGGSLYFALGILGAAIGFAVGTGTFLALSGRTTMRRMAAYQLLSYCQAIR